MHQLNPMYDKKKRSIHTHNELSLICDVLNKEYMKTRGVLFSMPLASQQLFLLAAKVK